MTVRFLFFLSLLLLGVAWCEAKATSTTTTLHGKLDVSAVMQASTEIGRVLSDCKVLLNRGAHVAHVDMNGHFDLCV